MNRYFATYNIRRCREGYMNQREVKSNMHFRVHQTLNCPDRPIEAFLTKTFNINEYHYITIVIIMIINIYIFIRLVKLKAIHIVSECIGLFHHGIVLVKTFNDIHERFTESTESQHGKIVIRSRNISDNGWNKKQRTTF